MNETLYRKYRPQSFADVVGQDSIVQSLSKAIQDKKTAHAYLFTGSRGTGKTTIARIVAHDLGVQPVDIEEIDAASNRGIDDIRALREAVHSLPFSSPYKVYIIDEVHMLTKEAFNALLKTLEEPPKHIIFILATTDLEKVPETVSSRCQTVMFRRPTETILANHVINIAKQEGRILEPDAAGLVAMLADGAFRDALGILQKVLNSTDDKKVSVDIVSSITGAPAMSMVLEMLEGVVTKDTEKSLAVIQKLHTTKSNIDLFVHMLLEKYRLLLLARIAPTVAKESMTLLSETEQTLFTKLIKENVAGIQSKYLSGLLDVSG
ncbi:MAG: DNA polymerase III subunit gamma/tau, partial [Minisyncoccia bacterium]